VFGGGVFSNNTVASESHIDDNLARATGDIAQALGGGVTGQALALEDSTLDRNTANAHGDSYSTAQGGGAHVEGQTLNITKSEVLRNASVADPADIGADAGAGGIFARNAVLVGARVEENVASSAGEAYGGGIVTYEVTAADSTIARNRATATAQHGVAYAAGLWTSGGNLTSSTVSTNTATAGAHSHAAGVLHAPVWLGQSDHPLKITNSTITENITDAPVSENGGIEEAGGGGRTTLIASTVARNSAAEGANLGTPVTTAAVDAPPTIELFGTVVALPAGGGANCGSGLAVTQLGWSVADDDSCGVDQIADPQLGVLADNGGPTPTLLPAATSPLLDRVPSAECLARVTVDQRGVIRPQRSACDIGAVEAVRNAPPSDALPDLSPDLSPDVSPDVSPAVTLIPRFTG
jgi:hypothetical protein